MNEKPDADLIAAWLAGNKVRKLPQHDARSDKHYDNPSAIIPRKDAPPLTEDDAEIADASICLPGRVSLSGIRKEGEWDVKDDCAAMWLNENEVPVLSDDLNNIILAQSGDEGAMCAIIDRYYPIFSKSARDARKTYGLCGEEFWDEVDKSVRAAIMACDLTNPSSIAIGAVLSEAATWSSLTAQQEKQSAVEWSVDDEAIYRQSVAYGEFNKFNANKPYYGDHKRSVERNASKRYDIDPILVPMDYWPERVIKYVKLMPKYERRILIGLYNDGMSVSDLARELTVTPSAICQRRDALKGDLVSRFGQMVFHDGAALVAPKRLRIRVAKKNGKSGVKTRR